MSKRFGMKKLCAGSLLLLLAILVMISGITTSAMLKTALASGDEIPAAKLPQQIGLAMTDDPQTSISINWTTIDTTLTDAQVKVWEKNAEESTAVTYEASIEKRTVVESIIKDENGQVITEKNFYSATLDELKPNTEYSYRLVAYDGETKITGEVRNFKTAPASEDPYTFIYVADPQVSGFHAKAWNANLDIAKEMFPDARFIYIAGDLTDKTPNEGQWEGFFNQPGNEQYNDKYSGSWISELPVAATMGNHDGGPNKDGADGMASHYTWLSQIDGIPVTYAFDYGAARFIILNTEYRADEDLEKQIAFLRQEVAEAKDEGKWTIVGMHKTPYSGGDHMDDADVKLLRQRLAPVFVELDVDMVLQGHDHVLSRGLVKLNGYKADVTEKIGDRTYSAKAPGHAPLYYVANCGSTLKFYSPLKDNDWISEYDPVAPDYGFLDIDSAMPVGHALNPLGPSTDDEQEEANPNFYRAPTFVAVTVSEDSVKFDTYMTGFDSEANTVVKDTFLYDSFTLNKADVDVSLAPDKDSISADSNGTVELSIAAKDETGEDIDLSNAAITYQSYNDDVLKVAADGTVTAQNRPADDVTVNIWAEVNDGVNTYISNILPIKVDVVPPARISGQDRFETAVAAAKKYYPLTSTVILAANTNDFADGLAANMLAGTLEAPILLTNTDEIPAAVDKYMMHAGVKNVYLLGGPTVISEDIEKELVDKKYTVTRIYGDNREATAAAIANKAEELGGQLKDTAIVVNGYAPADALAAGPAVSDGMPLLMVNRNSIPVSTRNILNESVIKNIIIVGGTGVVSPVVADELEELVSGTVVRAGGIDRIATSIALAERLKLPNAVMVGYNGLADAVAAGYVGSIEKSAVLYTQQEQLDKNADAYLDSIINEDSRVMIMGGTGVVDNSVEGYIRNKIMPSK
ncbi:cell wall-binding repeat-containing protein [Mahella australiensis]|uniref:Metallophosphoesterase n=1 Tax=Mahella australiensis (strain DSM 15567 / CIP 107919 / 50-1 BON) TaxID=697281 RepID=F4A079_MAHA5|nr:cell wall-binding repeat-containing protein [Mahella australiensis]AEE96913.1 metallophosphoesterase [Mahella australiensis 50-1 BON]